MYPGWQEDAFWERCREREEQPLFGEGKIDFSKAEEKAAAADYGCELREMDERQLKNVVKDYDSVIPVHAFWDDGIVYQYGLFD